jgi:cation transport regulator ChaC
MLGSMADYLLNTAIHLEEMGIHDATVWQMQELVAEQQEQMP